MLPISGRLFISFNCDSLFYKGERDHFHQVESQSKLMQPPADRRVAHRKMPTASRNSRGFVKTNPIKVFFSWCDSMGELVEIFQWSDSDQRQILKEMELKQIVLTEKEKCYFSRWSDFQKEFGEKLGLENQVSLKNAIMYAGIEIDGYFHDALYDARNTAALFRTARDPEICRKALDRVIRVLKPEPVKTTLGEMFDFGSLGISA